MQVTKGRASGSGHVIYSRPLHSELHNQGSLEWYGTEEPIQ